MKDMYGEVVVNGDFLAEGNEDHAYIFEVIENKPILVARLGIGELQKYSIEDVEQTDIKMKAAIEAKKAPTFMKDYYETMLKRMQEMKTESLAKAKNTEIFEKFVREGHESIAYTSQLSEDYNGEVIAYFPDMEIKEVN